MKTEIITIALMMMIALAGATAVIAGTSYSFKSEQFEYWDVVGNSSSMDGMDIEWADGNTTVSFAINYKPDTFTLVLYNSDSEVIVEVEHHYSSSGSSGGSSIIYRDRNITITSPAVAPLDTTAPSTCDPEIEEVYKMPLWGYLLIALAGLIFLIFIIRMLIVKDEDEDDDEFEDIDEDEQEVKNGKRKNKNIED